MIVDEIQSELFNLQDIKYRDFQSKLIPNIEKNNIIGVKTPELKSLAKQYVKNSEIKDFLIALPHRYFDENQLHAFIIAQQRDFKKCLEEVERFLPYIDNWATCDQLSPQCFKKNYEALLPYIEKWLESEKTYTVRFAIGALMRYFLGDSFKPEYAVAVASVSSNEYYVNMMRAWYFATALAKNYDEVLPFIESKKLDRWSHNKSIQKAVESYRITPEQKQYLKTLKIK